MIKNGDISNLLVRPVNIVKYIYAEEMGGIVNILVNAALSAVLGIIMAGILQLSFIQCIIFAVSIVISILMYISLQVVIGLIAFITEENDAFYWIISKITLLLVLTPLEFFPGTIQKILLCIPTTYMVYSPGKIFVHFDLFQSLKLILGQLISLLVIFGIIKLLSKKGVKNINVNGG
jgi:ABC-2 type transport system permease protein